MKKLLIINLFLTLIFSYFLNTVSAITITDDLLSNNINKINSILETKVDTDNPNYLTEILDENGNVPSYEYYPTHIESRSIKALQAYDGKIFMGLGDWNDNTGPAKMIYYDTVDGTIKTSGTINDEAVQQFTIINDKLYTTGCDPRDSWGYGSYYIYNKETNTWDKHMKNDGWVHIFNIVEFKDKLFMCGSIVDSTVISAIQSSSDNGETFESIPIYNNNEPLDYYSNSIRVYNFVILNDKLYGYIYCSTSSSYNGFYEYDEENNRFDYISNLSWSPKNTINYNVWYMNHAIFNNQFLFPNGEKIRISNDMKTFTQLDPKIKGDVQKMIVRDDTLYTLTYDKITSRYYVARIYSSKDLSEFNLVYEFQTEAMPFSLEYYENSLYVGTGLVYTGSKNGSLYRIDLNNTKKSLNLNKEDKTIEILDSGKSSLIEYDLSAKNPIFKTTLTFDNSMLQHEWLQEYYKIQNLSLVYTSVANNENVDFDNSTSYFNDILKKGITTSSKNSTTALKYAQDMFSTEINIQDKLFSLTSTKISESETEYKTLITLTVNKTPEKDDTNNNIINNNVNNNIINNIINNNTINNTVNNNISNNVINNNTITNDNINTNTNVNNNNNNNNTININNIISNLLNNTNTSLNDFIQNNDKLPQTGRFFGLKHLLELIIIVSVTLILILTIQESKLKKE